MTRPDAFLRRVIAQRELEQEQQILDMEAGNCAPAPCRVCSGKVNATCSPQSTVCSKCGGRQRERALKKADQARAARGLGPAPIDLMPRKCSRGCGRKLSAANISGMCKTCRFKR